MVETLGPLQGKQEVLKRAPPLKAPPIGRSANCTFPQDCSSLQEDCAYFTTEDWFYWIILDSTAECFCFSLVAVVFSAC